MIQKISRLLLYKMMGWKADVSVPIYEKCIMCIAPHTSNWDFIIGLLYSRAEGFKSNFLMKKEWFVGPVGKLMRHLGGIPVNRSKKTSLTDQLAEVAEKSKSFHLAITPEGTRKPVTDWKKGFYYIAMKADLPIILFGLDYETKTIIGTKEIRPNGDIDGQMREIKLYYKDRVGKHPQKFICEP